MNEVIQALPDGPALKISLTLWGVIWRGVLLLGLASIITFVGTVFWNSTGGKAVLGISGYLYGCLCHSFFRAVTASDGVPNIAVNLLLFAVLPVLGLVVSRGKGWAGVGTLLAAALIAKAIDRMTEGLSTFGLF